MGKVRWSREQRRAHERLNEVVTIFKEAKQAKRWDDERKCYLDPQGNHTVDPKTVDINALVAAIPTTGDCYIDEVVELKRELAEKEKKNNKLQSYHASSYILKRIFNITPDDNDSEKNKKGICSEYHQIPPPLEKKYTLCDDENVAKAINMVDQLPENIDVTYSLLLILMGKPGPMK
ncbi:hypothetical protein Hanom_Chr09g00808961 [Helianthus anomalus]